MTTQNASQVDCKWNYEFLNLVYNSNVQTSIGFALPQYAEIDARSMMVFVKTVDATETINVGLLSTEAGGDADGFIVGLSIATAGWIKPAPTYSQGSQSLYVSATTFGVLFLPAAQLGANQNGYNSDTYLKNHIGDGTAKTITYTCSAGSDSFVGVLAFRWRQFPDPTFWRWTA